MYCISIFKKCFGSFTLNIFRQDIHQIWNPLLKCVLKMRASVGLRAEYPIWLEHKCSGIYNFYPLTHQGSHAFHKNRRKGKRNLPLVDRFVKPSKSASWFIQIFKGAAFLKSDHPLQVSTHEQIMNDLVEC